MLCTIHYASHITRPRVFLDMKSSTGYQGGGSVEFRLWDRKSIKCFNSVEWSTNWLIQTRWRDNIVLWSCCVKSLMTRGLFQSSLFVFLAIGQSKSDGRKHRWEVWWYQQVNTYNTEELCGHRNTSISLVQNFESELTRKWISEGWSVLDKLSPTEVSKVK